MSAFTQKSSSAAAASLVVSPRAGQVLHLAGYNAKTSAQFIQLHDAAAVPADATGEIATCNLGSLTPAQLANKYFLISSPTVDYYVWFNLDAGGVDPAPAGKTAIPVAITTGESVADMATAAAAAINAIADLDATAASTTITIVTATGVVLNHINAGTSGAAVAVTTVGADYAVPVAVITAPASSNWQIPLPAVGLACKNGVVVCNSSTYAVKTAGSADCFFTGLVL